MRQVGLTRLVVGAAGLAALAIAGTLAVVVMRPAVAQGPDEKAQIEQRYQSDKLLPPHPKNDPAAKGGPTVIQTNPPPPTGIIEAAGAPFPSSEFRASNRWQAFVGDQLIAVLAGGPPDLTVGRLAVITFTKDGADVISVRWVDLPGRPGRARVASAQGTNSLVIETTGGQRFGFNPTLLQLTAIP